MRSTFSILFYINRGKVKADGTTAVMCRITIDGRSTAITTGIYCRPEDTHGKGKRQTAGVPEVYRTDLRGYSEDTGYRQRGNHQDPGDKTVRGSHPFVADG